MHIVLNTSTFSRLGLALDEPLFFPTFIPSLQGKKWTKFSGGLHHTLGLTAEGTLVVWVTSPSFLCPSSHPR